MNKELPTREQAIILLQENNCSQEVIDHCLAVRNIAIEVAHKLENRGIKIDLQLIETGALLHDIGRSKTHGVDHSLVGAQIARRIGLPQSIINIIKRHVGAGIIDEEAALLGWPKDNYVPQTLEEKVVCYADKRIDQNKVVPIEIEIKNLESKGMVKAAMRVRKLHKEIIALIGEET